MSFLRLIIALAGYQYKRWKTEITVKTATETTPLSFRRMNGHSQIIKQYFESLIAYAL